MVEAIGEEGLGFPLPGQEDARAQGGSETFGLPDARRASQVLGEGIGYGVRPRSVRGDEMRIGVRNCRDSGRRQAFGLIVSTAEPQIAAQLKPTSDGLAAVEIGRRAFKLGDQGAADAGVAVVLFARRKIR